MGTKGRNIGNGEEVFKHLARGQAHGEPLINGQNVLLFKTINAGRDVSVVGDTDSVTFHAGTTTTGSGFGNYDDIGTSAANLGATAGEFLQLTCDKLGGQNTDAFVPADITTLWDSTGNNIDFLASLLEINFQFVLTLS